MFRKGENKKGHVYQLLVTVFGITLWTGATAAAFVNYDLSDIVIFFTLALVAIFVGMFPQHFRLPSGLRFTKERITFTLSDAVVLIVAVWYGVFPAVFVAGIEGFTSSRRTVRRLSSNLFSSGMMSIAAAAAGSVSSTLLYYVFDQPSGGGRQALLAVSFALLASGIVQFGANAVLLSTLLALRHGNSIFQSWKDFFWAMPMFLPTSTAASLIYVALQYDLLTVIIIAAPVLITIYLAQRQYRDGVQKRIAIMDKAHRETIEALAVAINAKDEVTHDHVFRVQIYAAGVARMLGCSDAEIEALKAGALLHDIGKIAVPDYILNKPGKLTAAEFEKMKYHTIAGARILSRVEFPYPVVPVVRHHHERWDGGGYPDGLKGEEIPLTARILSVVDCFDAVREDRQYRKSMSREEAINLIIKGSGTQYDPRIVGAFISHLPEFEEAIRRHRGAPLPTFGIEPVEELSEAARRVLPATGLAEDVENENPAEESFAQNKTRSLCDLARSLLAARNQSALLAAFADNLNLLVPFDLCGITLVVPGTGDMVVAHATGRYAELFKGRHIGLGQGVTGWAIANRKAFCNVDPRLDLPSSIAELLGDCCTLAVFPIIEDNLLYGAVSLYSSALEEYTSDHQKIIGEAVAMMSAALSTLSPRVTGTEFDGSRTDDDRQSETALIA